MQDKTDHSNYIPESFQNLEEYPIYSGTDLGLTYQKDYSTFKLWAPNAQKVNLSFYKNALAGTSTVEHAMHAQEKGVWSVKIEGDLEGLFYNFTVLHNGSWLMPVPDPYAKAVGTNGQRAQVVNLKQTNPLGWNEDVRPKLKTPTDIVIYELHLRDLSMHPNSGISQKGKYLGLTELGTKNKEGLSTGIDHLKEMGITHLHLQPVFDFISVDESQINTDQYNWGYDPHNYNVPEGSYSSNPSDGATRIKELKSMVKALHDAGIRVILDVVYNHTGLTEASIFNQLVPDYYYRKNDDGSFSDASGCGNETASERPMFRKMIIDSVKFWANEYHIDGFRFDLIGIHDIETMNFISTELHAIDPTIFNALSY